jgi:hypothetical protein
VPINASIAVLASDSTLAKAVAHQINEYQRFSPLNLPVDNEADPTITFGVSVILTAFDAMPEAFDPPQLGSYLGWGADIALLVVDSSQGLDGESIQRAQEVAQFRPLMVAVTGLDSPRANFDESLAVISRVMDQRHHAVAITLPVLSDSESFDQPEVGGILDLVSLEIRVPRPHGAPEAHELEQAHYDLIESHIDALTNAVVVTSTDEELILSVIDQGFESVDQLRDQLISATTRREIIPVFAIAGSIGVSELANFACDLDPEPWTPAHMPNGELLASSLGDGYLRVWQGELLIGTYFADSNEIHITQIHSITGQAKSTTYAAEIVRIAANCKIPAGSSVSSAKSNPLAINHAFE